MSIDYSASSSLRRAESESHVAARTFNAVASAVARFFAEAAAHYRAARDIRQLQALSDQTLRDIGVHRSEITSMVHMRTFRGVDRRHGQN
jgi:uncharacterized protein YjiS (DUF1127 family)